MSEPKPEHEKQTLDYQSAADHREDTFSVVSCIVTAIVTVGVLMAVVFGLILVLVATDRPVIPIVLGGVVLLGINGLAFSIYRGMENRGVAIGIWIGIGLTVLMDGVCFSGGLRF